MTSKPEIREAPVPVRHDWLAIGPAELSFDEAFEDAGIAERFATPELVKFHDDDGYFPCRVWLNNGQTVIVRAKQERPA